MSHTSGGNETIAANKKNIELLSKYLTLNAICHSVDTEAQIEDVAMKDLKRPFHDIEKYSASRNILIIGAGASHNAHPEIPTGEKFAADIHASFNKTHKNMLEKHLDYLARVFNLKRNEFETVLLACSRLDNEKVLDELKESYDYKHVPNLFYEIVGHLFKHRFIDIIINFNFDELLDNVIEEEMSHMDYDFVLSDGNVPGETDDLMFGHRLKKPIYIKPHGTISHPSSLRFNKEQYYALPTKISELLEKLFEAEYTKEETKNKKGYLQLNFIVTGFRMQSMDFNFILEKAFQKRIEKNSSAHVQLFVFDIMEEGAAYYKILPPSLKDWVSLSECIRYVRLTGNKQKKLKETRAGDKLITTDPEPDTLEGAFLVLWNNIKNNFKDDLLRNITRHLIITEIFQDKTFPKPLRIFRSKDELTDYSNISEFYLLSRIYVEIAILLMSSAGFINLVQISESRVQKYYVLLKKVYKLLEKPLGTYDSFYNILREFGFEKYKGFIIDAFVYTLYQDKQTFIEATINTLFQKLADLQKKYKSPSFKKNEAYFLNPVGTGKKSEVIRNYFRGLSKNYGWEIKPDFNKYNISKFSNVTDYNLLHTDLRYNIKRLSFYTGEKEYKYNVVLSISKKASFLEEDNEIVQRLKKNSPKKLICMVLSTLDIGNIDNANGESIKENLEKLKETCNFECIIPDSHGEFRTVPWWLLNQQLHVFLQVKKTNFDMAIQQEANESLLEYDERKQKLITLFEDNIKYVSGIYYQRRLFSRKVNPIFFDNTVKTFKNKEEKKGCEDNLKELVNIFVNYWARADKWETIATQKGNEFFDAKIELYGLINKVL